VHCRFCALRAFQNEKLLSQRQLLNKRYFGSVGAYSNPTRTTALEEATKILGNDSFGNISEETISVEGEGFESSQTESGCCLLRYSSAKVPAQTR
jgi:hypothetical protein